MSTRTPLRLRASALLVLLLSVFGSLVVSTPADATVSWRSQVPAEAAKHKGAPYVWGAAGPTRFDCSGLTMYDYGRFGKRLPHNAARQYNLMRHLGQSGKVRGDLLFFRNSSGRISHVAIYAGVWSGKLWMWHAPHTGSVVKLVPVYSNRYLVGRL